MAIDDWQTQKSKRVFLEFSASAPEGLTMVCCIIGMPHRNRTNLAMFLTIDTDL